MEQITLKIARFTANNTLAKPYITSKKTIDINKIKYIHNTGSSYEIYYFKGRPSIFQQPWLFEEHLKWAKESRLDYEDFFKEFENSYKGAYLMEYDEIVKLLKTEFELVDEENVIFKRKNTQC